MAEAQKGGERETDSAEDSRIHSFPLTDSSLTEQGDLRGQWALAGVVLVVGLLFLIGLFLSTVASMIDTWQASSSFGHGFLIVPICLYLIWRRRDQLAQTVPRPDAWGLPVMAAGACFWLLGYLAGLMNVQQVAVVIMVQALVLTMLGRRATWIMAFPLFYLLFAVPIGTFAIAPLQDFTAQFVVGMLRLIGIPVYLDGVFFHIPSGSFEVAEACAGLRFLISSVALGVIFANLFYHETWRRLLFVALSVTVPIIANGFRAFGIVMLAHYSDYRLAAEADHITYGLIFLSIVFFCLLALGVTFRERNPVAPAPVRRRAQARPAGAAALLVAGAAALLLAGIAPAYATIAKHRFVTNAAIPVAPPLVQSAWQLWPKTVDDWRPRFVNVDAETLRTYGDGRQQVDVYLGYFAYQRQGAEVVNARNTFAEEPLWERAGGGRTEATVDGKRMTVNYQRLLSGARHRVVWYWYWVDGEFTSSPYVAKLLELRAKLWGGMQAAAVVAVAADYAEQPSNATDVLRDFLAETGPFGATLAHWAT